MGWHDVYRGFFDDPSTNRSSLPIVIAEASVSKRFLQSIMIGERDDLDCEINVHGGTDIEDARVLHQERQDGCTEESIGKAQFIEMPAHDTHGFERGHSAWMR